MLRYLHGAIILCGLKILSYKVTVTCFRNRPKISHIFVVAWISRLAKFRKTRWKCHCCGPVILAVIAHSAVDNLDACLRTAIYAIICEHLSEYCFLRWEVQGIHPRNPIWLVSFAEGVFAIHRIKTSFWWQNWLSSSMRADGLGRANDNRQVYRKPCTKL